MGEMMKNIILSHHLHHLGVKFLGGFGLRWIGRANLVRYLPTRPGSPSSTKPANAAQQGSECAKSFTCEGLLKISYRESSGKLAEDLRRFGADDGAMARNDAAQPRQRGEVP